MADELGGAKKLETAQSYASSSLVALDARIAQLRTYSTDYSSLLTRLQTLPQKTRHEIMVPLGPLAFQPGYIQHTNEITVLLGENFFVERSASQAAEIIKRRLAYLKKQIETIEKQVESTSQIDSASKQLFGGKQDGKKGKFDTGLGVTFDGGVMRNEDGEEIVEIKEEFIDEEEEEKVTQPTSASSAALSSSTSDSLSSSSSITGARDFPSMFDKNFDDFWAELEHLEAKQEAAEEAQDGGAIGSERTNTSASSGVTIEEMEEDEKAQDKNNPPQPSLEDILPVPSPQLRPITNPADIFRHITQAKIQAGELPPLGPSAASKSSSSATPSKASSSASSSSSSSSLSLNAAISASNDLDAMFAAYKSPALRAERKQKRRAQRAAAIAAKQRWDEPSDSEDEAIDKGEPVQPSNIVPPSPRSILSKKSGHSKTKSVSFGDEPAAPPARTAASSTSTSSATRVTPTLAASSTSRSTSTAATRPTPTTSTASSSGTSPSTFMQDAFTGEIKERVGGDSAALPSAASSSTVAAPHATSSTATQRTFTSAKPAPPRSLAKAKPSGTLAPAADAPQPKMSKFKMRALGLQPDEE